MTLGQLLRRTAAKVKAGALSAAQKADLRAALRRALKRPSRYPKPPREGLDWAWGHLSAAQVKASGRNFACRYLSHDPSKNLSPTEAKEHSAGGVDDVVVWETSAGRATAGRAAGQSDARDAIVMAKGCGMPANRPIYFAVDQDVSDTQVADYFAGTADVLGVARNGAYGGIRVISGLFDRKLITYGWQTYAWSGGQWDARAQLRQYSNGHTASGVSVDYDRSVAADFGQWRA